MTDKNLPDISDEDIWRCGLCSVNVRVAGGADANMTSHQKSAACIAKVKANENKPKYLQFFQKWALTAKLRVKAVTAPTKASTSITPLRSSRKTPPSTYNSYPELSNMTKCMLEICNLAEHIPASVPIGKQDDFFATTFATYPEVLPNDEAWETVDQILNRTFGNDIPLDTIADNIRRGKYGMDSVRSWITKPHSVHGIANALLEGKYTRLKLALEHLCM